MKIGIIAVGRSGGYNLGSWISNELGYEYIHEPVFNNIDVKGKTPIVIKYHILEWNKTPKPYQMDKWIGLIREDIRETAISNIRAEQKREWHNPYKLTTDWIKENEENIKNRMPVLREFNEMVSKGIPEIELNITYEGIYNSGKDIGKVIEYLGIENPKYLHMLNPQLRLRNRYLNKINLI
jgi:hypothetical protein